MIHHPVYASIRTLPDLALFMEHHVAAVWDFMALLKFLQLRLTSVSVLWKPTPFPAVRRMINEIVLAEESDLFANGEIKSHFEMYVEAMRAVGANTGPIESLLFHLEQGLSIHESLVASKLPAGAQAFIRDTFQLIERGDLCEIAAVFSYTREGLIPEMFFQIVAQLDKQFPRELSLFVDYLKRHIELDGDQHGPLADQMVKLICGDHPGNWDRAEKAVVQGLNARAHLWDSVSLALGQ